MFELAVHDRRLVAVRILSCDTLDEAKAMARDIRDAMIAAPGLVIATADLRGAQLFSPEVTEALLALLKADNPKVERSAHLVGDGALFAMQIERLVREAGNPRRKVFRALPDVEAYLGEVITPPQRGWLHKWYIEGTVRAPGA